MNADVEMFRSIAKQMGDLYEKKNANYGNSFEKLYKELGPIAGIVPLHNKLDRLTNLIKGGRNDFESVEDTLVDLANYAIMNIIELRRSESQKTQSFESKGTCKTILNEGRCE